MSNYDRLVEILAHGEQNDGAFLIDRTAFTLALAHRGGIINGNHLVKNLPKLKTQFEDCLAQNNKSMNRHQALLLIVSDINDEDTNGYAADQIRKFADFIR